jgi:hypothetical protein
MVSGLGPLADQVVVDAGQTRALRVFQSALGLQFPDRPAEAEPHGVPAVTGVTRCRLVTHEISPLSAMMTLGIVVTVYGVSSSGSVSLPEAERSRLSGAGGSAQGFAPGAAAPAPRRENGIFDALMTAPGRPLFVVCAPVETD